MSKKPIVTVDPASTPDPVANFESALKELEDIVTAMERDDLPLEQSLQLFERGVSLTRDCRASLSSAELRVKNLLDAESGT